MSTQTYFSLGALALGVGLSGGASAAVITQSINHTFANPDLSGATTLTFDGFNASLGTLTNVQLVMTVTETLNDLAINTKTSAQAVGNPTALTAIATTTLTGPSGLNATSTLVTDGYTGMIAAAASKFSPTVTVVGTKTMTGATFTGATTSVASYIGGASSVSLALTNESNQGGTVNSGVFTGNSGSAYVVAELRYTYSTPEIPPPSDVPEPAGVTLLGAGLTALGTIRRRRSKAVAL